MAVNTIYFRDPNGQLLEMACYQLTPPEGHSLSDVLGLAYQLRLEAGDYVVGGKHLAGALDVLSERPEPADEPLQPA